MIQNTGSYPLELADIAVVDSGGGAFALAPPDLSQAVPAGGSLSVEISFSPTSLGLHTGSLLITPTAPDAPITVELQGTGAEPVIQLSTSTLEFGALRLGTSAIQPVTVTNASSLVSLELTSAQITGDRGFALRDPLPPAGITLPPGTSVDFAVTFSPSAVGEATGALTLATDDLGAPPSTVALHAEGVFADLELGLLSGVTTVQAAAIEQVELRMLSGGVTDTEFQGLVELETSDPNSPLNGILVLFEATDLGVKELPLLPLFFTPGAQAITGYAVLDDGSTHQIGRLTVEVLQPEVGRAYVAVPTGTHSPGSTLIARVLIDLGPDDGDPATLADTLGCYEARLIFDGRALQVTGVRGGSSPLGSPLIVQGPSIHSSVRFMDLNERGTLTNRLGPDPSVTGVLEVAQIDLLVREDAPSGPTQLGLVIDALSSAEAPSPQLHRIGGVAPRFAHTSGAVEIDSSHARAGLAVLGSAPRQDEALVAALQEPFQAPGIEVFFSRPLDSNSLGGVVVSKALAGSVSGTVSSGGVPHSLRFLPDTALDPGQYLLSLGSIRDAEGGHLSSANPIDFRVGPAAATVLGDLDTDGEVTVTDLQLQPLGTPLTIPPLFLSGASVELLALYEGDAVTQLVVIQDFSGLGVTATATGASFAELRPLSGGVFELVLAPGFEDSQTERYAIQIEATDGSGQSSTGEVSIEVLDFNHPPQLSPLVPARTFLSVQEQETLTFSVQASDADPGDTLTFSHVVRTLDGTVIDFGKHESGNDVLVRTDGVPTVNQATFALIPTYFQQGEYEIEVTVTDSGKKKEDASLTYNVEVKDLNRPPTITVVAVPDFYQYDNVLVDVGQKATITFTATDPDGDALSLDLDGLALEEIRRLTKSGLIETVLSPPCPGLSVPGGPSTCIRTLEVTLKEFRSTVEGTVNLRVTAVASDKKNYAAAQASVVPRGIFVMPTEFGYWSKLNRNHVLMSPSSYEEGVRYGGFYVFEENVGAFEVSQEDVKVTGVESYSVFREGYRTLRVRVRMLDFTGKRTGVVSVQGTDPLGGRVWLSAPLEFLPVDSQDEFKAPIIHSPVEGSSVGTYVDVKVEIPNAALVHDVTVWGSQDLGMISESWSGADLTQTRRVRFNGGNQLTVEISRGGAKLTESIPVVPTGPYSDLTPVRLHPTAGILDNTSVFIAPEGLKAVDLEKKDSNPFVFRYVVPATGAGLEDGAELYLSILETEDHDVRAFSDVEIGRTKITLSPSATSYQVPWGTSDPNPRAGLLVSPPILVVFRDSGETAPLNPIRVESDPVEHVVVSIGAAGGFISSPGVIGREGYPAAGDDSLAEQQLVARVVLPFGHDWSLESDPTRLLVPGITVNDGLGTGYRPAEYAILKGTQPQYEVYFPFSTSSFPYPASDGSEDLFTLFLDQGEGAVPLVPSGRWESAYYFNLGADGNPVHPVGVNRLRLVPKSSQPPPSDPPEPIILVASDSPEPILTAEFLVYTDEDDTIPAPVPGTLPHPQLEGVEIGRTVIADFIDNDPVSDPGPTAVSDPEISAVLREERLRPVGLTRGFGAVQTQSAEGFADASALLQRVGRLTARHDKPGSFFEARVSVVPDQPGSTLAGEVYPAAIAEAYDERTGSWKDIMAAHGQHFLMGTFPAHALVAAKEPFATRPLVIHFDSGIGTAKFNNFTNRMGDKNYFFVQASRVIGATAFDPEGDLVIRKKEDQGDLTHMDDESVNPSSLHGTHTLPLLAGDGIGDLLTDGSTRGPSDTVLGTGKDVLVRPFKTDPEGSPTRKDTLLKLIANDSEAKVVVVDTGFFNKSTVEAAGRERLDEIALLYRRIAESGKIVVFPAGNEGLPLLGQDAPRGILQPVVALATPRRADRRTELQPLDSWKSNVLSVGWALSSKRGGTPVFMSPNSNHGKRLSLLVPFGPNIGVTAGTKASLEPGIDLMLQRPSSSFAAPVLGGALAELLLLDPTLKSNPVAAVELLEATGDAVDPLARTQSDVGHGSLNFWKSALCALNKGLPAEPSARRGRKTFQGPTGDFFDDQFRSLRLRFVADTTWLGFEIVLKNSQNAELLFVRKKDDGTEDEVPVVDVAQSRPPLKAAGIPADRVVAFFGTQLPGRSEIEGQENKLLLPPIPLAAPADGDSFWMARFSVQVSQLTDNGFFSLRARRSGALVLDLPLGNMAVLRDPTQRTAQNWGVQGFSVTFDDFVVHVEPR